MIRVKGDPLPKSVTKSVPSVTGKLRTVTEIRQAAGKRGRPKKADALTPAQKQKAYRERKRHDQIG